MTMRTALRSSSNRAAVRMLMEVGIQPTVRYAKDFGVGDVPGVPSLALGSGEVTLMSMAAAYASFANAGMRPEPALIRRVETLDGQVIYTGGQQQERVVSEATAFLMSDMLADVVTSGTAASVRRVGFSAKAAGKTGTTNDYHDAWFIGYTPTLVTGVWVGYDMPRTIIRNGYAAQLAVPMWGRFMKAATRNEKSEWFKSPRTVTTATICSLSGRLATSDCRYVASYDSDGSVTMSSAVYTERFVRGTEPTTYCDLHGRYDDDWRVEATTGDDSPRPVAASAAPEAAARRAGAAAAAERAERAPSPAPARDGVLPAAAPGSPEAATPTQRRGFWSRIFRRGQDRPRPTPQDEGRTR
jgi:penicillin-binding protein 1A